MRPSYYMTFLLSKKLLQNKVYKYRSLRNEKNISFTTEINKIKRRKITLFST
jgi:hypothetical protein